MPGVCGGVEAGAESEGVEVTSLKCHRCGLYWSVQTLWPDKFSVITRFCPPCVAVVVPQLGLIPFPKRRPA